MDEGDDPLMEDVQSPAWTPEEQLTQMVSQHQSALLALCFAYLHDREQAKDAVQETFLRAYRALNNFRGGSSEKTWLTRIAINVCRDARKSAWIIHVNRRITPEDLPLSAPENHDPDVACLAAAIHRLPDKLKEAVLLYYYQDMTMTEIAQALGVSPSIISRRIKKAHAKLQGLLGEEDFYE